MFLIWKRTSPRRRESASRTGTSSLTRLALAPLLQALTVVAVALFTTTPAAAQSTGWFDEAPSADSPDASPPAQEVVPPSNATAPPRDTSPPSQDEPVVDTSSTQPSPAEPSPRVDSKPAEPAFAKTRKLATAKDVSEYDADDPEIDVPYPQTRHFTLKSGAFGTVSSLHQDRVVWIGPHLSLGSEGPLGSVFGDLALASGKTTYGLTAWRFTAGIEFEWPVRPFRFGFAPRVGLLEVDRITAGKKMLDATLGVAFLASIDLVHTDGFALNVGARPSVDALSDGGGLYGMTGVIDFQWRSPRHLQKAVNTASRPSVSSPNR